MSSLKDFLQVAKKQLHDSQKNKTPITLVMGNDKADVDTIAATLLFAYLRASAPKSGGHSEHYIPLIQVDRKSLASVHYLSKVVPHIGTELKDLLVLDDMSLDGKQSHLSAETTHLFLINWNELLGRQGEDFSKNIEGAIDPHKDSGYVPQQTPDLRIIGTHAGSATSLVVNALKNEWKTSRSQESHTMQHLASLGLAGILVPTKDLKHNATREDEEAYEFLAGLYGKDFNRHHFYTSIVGEDTPREPMPAVSREPVAPTTTVPQATGSGIGAITQERASAYPPQFLEGTAETGGPHTTFTGNRLDPLANETVQSYHTEVLPQHIQGGERATHGGSGPLSTGYSRANTADYSTTGASTTGTSTGLTSGTTGSGYDSTVGTTGSGYGSSTTGTTTTTGEEKGGFLSGVMGALGLGHKSHEHDTTTGTSGLGSSNTAYEGEGVGQRDTVASGMPTQYGADSTSSPYGHERAYDANTHSTGVSNLVHSHGHHISHGDDAPSSTSGVAGTSTSTGTGSNTTGTDSSVQDKTKELVGDAQFGGERGGTGNGKTELGHDKPHF